MNDNNDISASLLTTFQILNFNKLAKGHEEKHSHLRLSIGILKSINIVSHIYALPLNIAEIITYTMFYLENFGRAVSGRFFTVPYIHNIYKLLP